MRALRGTILAATLAVVAISSGTAVHAGGGSIPWPRHAGEYQYPPLTHSDAAEPCTPRQMERARDLAINGGTVRHIPAADSCIVRVAQRRAINKADGAAEPFYRTFNDDAFYGAETFDRECVHAAFANHENMWVKPVRSYWVNGGRCPS